MTQRRPVDLKKNQSDVQLSKFLSWLLRHGAHERNLILKDGGFVDVESILMIGQSKTNKWTEEDIVRVVFENDKKRFSLRNDMNGKLQIRANQGHTIQGIKNEELLTNLSEITDVPENVIHGTYLKNWQRIKKVGLSRMKRNHIHFSVGLPGDSHVISGMRFNAEVYIYIDIVSAMGDGFTFYRSENNVILCEGNAQGFLPPKYFKEIWRSNPKERLS
ncbi:tRNA 2'-phosphotransferase 1 [Nymphon striatum]|nr:tRNA 2'-phosphotransferase 1 [Nymphon striatum]